MPVIRTYLLALLILLSACAAPTDEPEVSSTQAANNPEGSYQKSCRSISVSDDKLTATCRKLNESYQPTFLANLADCQNSIQHYGDIGNIDGNLICLPDLPKTDPLVTFPESESTINEWVYGNQTTNIIEHAWGIWAGLTTPVGQVDGADVRAFETWSTISNMQYQMQMSPQGALPRSMKLDLSTPRQFRNRKDIGGNLKNAVSEATTENPDTNIFVSVAYNPPAAEHAISNKLFLKSSLDAFLKAGYQEIPNFPANAITVKPVYKVVPADSPQGIYTFPGWPGTPDPAITFPEKSWGACVYLDMNGTGTGGHSIDTTCQQRDPSNTFNLSNFIHQRISEENARYLSTQLGITVNEGDYAILVGMHVTTRETKRWTWQTFWWSANPSAPYKPSSSQIAASRPAVLDPAAAHYAMSIAYQMVSPAQPVTGGSNVGESVIGYNPHLEAGFDPSVFQIIRKINGTIDNQYGVQTNCMTCHNLALYDPSTDYSDAGNREKPYGTDYYMPLDDPRFDGVLRLDFAWSVLGGLLLDE